MGYMLIAMIGLIYIVSFARNYKKVRKSRLPYVVVLMACLLVDSIALIIGAIRPFPFEFGTTGLISFLILAIPTLSISAVLIYKVKKGDI
ncbi:MAG: hypothetical protein ACYCVB_11900 [Bacilli bacterium]